MHGRLPEPVLSRIPRTIWTFWDDADKVPAIVQMCIATWRKHNPDYSLTVLTMDNHMKYTGGVDVRKIKHNDSKQRASDFVRLLVLAEHGGVWCDASTICLQSLDWVQRKLSSNPDADFVGFYLDGWTRIQQFPVIESWWFACIPRSPLGCAWRDEFMGMQEYPSIDAWLAVTKRDGVDTQGIDVSNYYAIHVAAQRVMQLRHIGGIDPSAARPAMELAAAERGPYRYLVETAWDSERAVRELMDGTQSRLIRSRGLEKPPFIKLRGCERGHLERWGNEAAIQGAIDAL